MPSVVSPNIVFFVNYAQHRFFNLSKIGNFGTFDVEPTIGIVNFGTYDVEVTLVFGNFGTSDVAPTIGIVTIGRCDVEPTIGIGNFGIGIVSELASLREMLMKISRIYKFCFPFDGIINS